MVKKNTKISIEDLSNTRRKEELILGEVLQHKQIGFEETDKRATGRGQVGTISFNEADELFRSWIDQDKWPYDAILFDPRSFNIIIEKTARLIANKPRGILRPRDGGDTLLARVNNTLLDYQWDMANSDGTMISKWSLMDINTRKYGAGFALVKWRYECDADGNVLFDGPDMRVLNNRDIAHSLSATSIENCYWFQVRQYVTPRDLEYVNDQSSEKPIYKNLKELKYKMQQNQDNNASSGGDSRSVNWTSRSRSIAGLETDPYGKDPAFTTIEIITEYRRDRWTTFAPREGVIIRDIPNPYHNNEIPIVMLRYLMVDDDLYGLSELEPIKGPQKAINAILSQYVDEINQKLYSPIAIGPGVRQHTLEWAKGARWLMNNPMSDYRIVETNSNAAQYFNNTYSVLVSMIMNATGESSLGISNIQPYQKDKTATEVKALQLQRNARDNYNQIFLAEAIKRQYALWHTMNQRLLFSDPDKKSYIIRIADYDAVRYFTGQGLHESDDDALELGGIGEDIINGAVNGQPMDDNEISMYTDIAPYKYAVNIGDSKSPQYVPKFKLDSSGKSGELHITNEDLQGQYDIIIDVQSMTSSADDERRQSRQAAVTALTTNPNVVAMLKEEGVKPKFKELFISWLEDLGFTDADRFFERIPDNTTQGTDIAKTQNVLATLASQTGGDQTGIPGGTNPNEGGEANSTSPFQNSGLGPISPKSVS